MRYREFKLVLAYLMERKGEYPTMDDLCDFLSRVN